MMNEQVARHCLWFFGYSGGYEPGSFTHNLLRALSTADSGNFRRLAQAFPEYAAAWSMSPEELRTAAGIGEEVHDVQDHSEEDG
jgi:hypothetical protein